MPTLNELVSQQFCTFCPDTVILLLGGVGVGWGGLEQLNQTAARNTEIYQVACVCVFYNLVLCQRTFHGGKHTNIFFKRAGQKWLIYCSKGTFGGWHQRSVAGEVGFLIRCSPVAAPALELKGWSTVSV